MSRLNLSNKRDFRLRKLVWRLALRLDVDPAILEPMVIDAVRVRCLNKVDFADHAQRMADSPEIGNLVAQEYKLGGIVVTDVTSLFGSAYCLMKAVEGGEFTGTRGVAFKCVEYDDYGTSISHKDDVVPYLNPELEDLQVATIHKYLDETVGREPRKEDLVYHVAGRFITKAKPYTQDELEAIRKHEAAWRDFGKNACIEQEAQDNMFKGRLTPHPSNPFGPIDFHPPDFI
jgi:hypothetical protein